MTIWYIDPTNGTDANASAGNGDSFSTRRKRIDNIVAAASAPGDTIRIMGSPDPTSLGVTGTWTNGPYSTTQAPTSSTNATPIVFTKVGHGLVTGDVVLINGHTTNTKANGIWDVTVSGNTFTLFNADGSNSVGNGAGINTGTFRKITNCQVKLASALTKTVALTGNQGTKVNWTPSANVTATLMTTDFKEGFNSQSLAIAAGFTTGLAAYYPLGATVDFSAYQQLTFWIKQTSGTVGAAGAVTITLCSDIAGVTAVDTFSVPTVGGTAQWIPFTVDKGSALGSAIQSIAFNVVTDNAAQTFLLDNIQACKASSGADAMTLQSLIGKNTTGESFVCIQSINSTRIMLDAINSTVALTAPQSGYFGTTETVTTYKRETFKLTLAASSGANVQSFQEAGTAGNLIAYSGGWNSTDMTTQTRETWFDGVNGYGNGINLASLNYTSLTGVAMVRYFRGISASTPDSCTINVIAVNNNSAGINVSTGTNLTINAPQVLNNSYGVYPGVNSTAVLGKVNGAITYGIVADDYSTITADEVLGSRDTGVDITSGIGATISIPRIQYNGSYGIRLATANRCTVFDCTISDSGTADVSVSPMAVTKSYLVRCTLNSATKTTASTTNRDQLGGVFSQGQDGDAANHIQYLNNGRISSDVVTRHTASGISWKLSPAEIVYTTANNPFYLSVAKIACASGTLVTASVWMRRTHTGLTAQLMCKGRQLLGVMSDVSTAMTAAADTWEQVIITFTPTEVGVVELLAECWGGTTYSLYVDDFTVSQA